MLNLFILVLIEQFSSSINHSHNPVEEFNNNLNMFQICWAKYTKKYKGIKMNYADLMDFFQLIGTDLGGFNKMK